MHLRYLILLVTSLLSGTVEAQWHTVLRLDTVRTGDIRANGDTILIRYSDDFGGHYLYSSNAGQSWAPGEGLEGIRYTSLFESSPRLFGVRRNPDTTYDGIVVSSNKIEHVSPLNDTAAYWLAHGFQPRVLFNPLDDNELYLVVEDDGPIETISLVFQSLDAGRTWRMLEMPFSYSGASQYDLIFDYSQKHHWYVAAYGDHIPMGKKIFETTDNGSSFFYRGLSEDIDDLFLHAGIEDPSVLRFLTGTGAVTFDLESNERREVEWLSRMDPFFGNTDRDAGFKHLLNYTYFEINRTAPKTAIVPRGTITYPPGGDPVDTILQQYYDQQLTTDNGETWSRIWDGYPSIATTFDASGQYIYILTVDSLFNKQVPFIERSRSTHSLRRLEVISALDVRKQEPRDELLLRPVDGHLVLDAVHSFLRIVDVVGRTVLQAHSVDRLDVGALPEGVYHLTAATDGKTRTQKFMIKR